MKLKKCPFCGSEAKICKSQLTNNTTAIWIGCTRCLSHTKQIRTSVLEDPEEQLIIDRCIDIWNMRADTST